MKKFIKISVFLFLITTLYFNLGIQKIDAQISNIVCLKFDNNLLYGDNNVDIDKLIKALSADGINISPGTLESKKVLFDEKVLTAVIIFQGKYNIPQTGFVGPLTRAVLNDLYNCGNVIAVPVNLNKGTTTMATSTKIITITSTTTKINNATTTNIGKIKISNPKGGENYNIGDTITVNWSTNYTGEYTDLILRRDNTFSGAPSNSGAQAQRVPNTGSYKMKIGNVGELGKYYIRMMCINTQCNIADTALFNIQSATTSTATSTKPSNKSGITVPTYSPSYSNSPTYTYTPTYKPSVTYTYTPSPTYTQTPTYTYTSTPTYTYTSSPSYSSSPSPSAYVSPSVSFIGNNMSLGAFIWNSIADLLGL